MTFEYHVTHKDTESKKKVAVSAKEELVAVIKERFSVHIDILLQQQFEDDWIDIENVSDIPDGGKLRFLTKATQGNAPVDYGYQRQANLETTPSTCQTPTTPTGVIPSGMGLYRLPTFPNDLAEQLRAGSNTLATCRRERARLVRILHDDLRARVGIYPKTADVRTVCSTLVLTYPCLEDKVKFGQCTTRYYTWFESLRQKQKDDRRGLTTDEQVMTMKAKYGGRTVVRHSSDPLNISETPRCKKARFDCTIPDNGEDDQSIQMHITTMKQQWARNNCDIAIVTDRMARTYFSRRELISSGSKLSEVLDSYPALKDQAQLQYEFVRLTKVNFTESLLKFWTPARVDLALRRLATDAIAKQHVSQALDTNVSDDRRNILMQILPRFFNEQLLCWTFISDSDDLDLTKLTVYPTMVMRNDEILIYFERTYICKCQCVLEAVATQFMLHYVLDIQYAKQVRSTYTFFDACVGRIDCKSKVSAAVQRKVNLLLAV